MLQRDALCSAAAKLPASHAVALGDQALGTCPAHLAHAQQRHVDFVSPPLRQLPPIAGVLLPGVIVETPMQRESRPQRGFGHGRAHGRVDHARHRHVRQARVAEQAVHAGPERLDQPQVGQALQQSRGWVRDHRRGDQPGVLRRRGQVPAGLRQGALQLCEPGVALVIVEAAAEQDVHAVVPHRSRRNCSQPQSL